MLQDEASVFSTLGGGLGDGAKVCRAGLRRLARLLFAHAIFAADGERAVTRGSA